MASESPSTSSSVRLGAIGCGGRLRHVLQLLVREHPAIELTSASDPYAPALDEIDAIAGRPVTRCDDWRDLVSRDDVDWVAISSPNRFHADQAIAALEAGKDVFCEKPLAINLKDCLRVRDAVERSGRRFVFGLVLRYSPHYQRLHQLRSEGRIGRLVSFEFNETLAISHGGYIFGNWRRLTSEAGSHILEKTCHDLDLANWLAGSLPVRVASFGGRSFFTPENAGVAQMARPSENGKLAFRAWDDPHGVDPFTGGGDILDHQVVILEYANGVRATFHTNAATALPERRFYLCGTEGVLRGDVLTGQIELKRIDGCNVEDHTSGASGGHGGGDKVMVDHLAATMLRGAPALAGIDEALRSAITAFAIDEAEQTGQVVELRHQWAGAGIEDATT